MKLFSLAVLYRNSEDKAVILSSYQDLSSFSFFQRGSFQEFMHFTTKLIAERSNMGDRSCVKHEDYMCHCYIRMDNLTAVLISDFEYPKRVAFTMMNKVLDDFSVKYPPSAWSSAGDHSLAFPELEQFLTKYQNPKEADGMIKLQTDLDETKIILHETINKVLQRGEKLDDLVDKSEALSMQSKAFYKTAKKTNQCCKIL